MSRAQSGDPRRGGRWPAVGMLIGSVLLTNSCGRNVVGEGRVDVPTTAATPVADSTPVDVELGCSQAVGAVPVQDPDSVNGVASGPVLFANVRDPIGPVTRDRDGRVLAVKTPTVVRKGSVVTIVVPAEEEGRMSLLYDRAAFSRGVASQFFIGDGSKSVRLRACEATDTTFAGGFIVDGLPRCAQLLLLIDGQERHFKLNFGASNC